MPEEQNVIEPSKFFVRCYSILKESTFTSRDQNLHNMQIHLRKMSSSKRIALVAHDNKKTELIEWAVYNKAALSKHKLFGTGTTGGLVETALGQPVSKFLSGPLGGDQQIGA